MYDLIVVGGGPAGSSAALMAARKGLQVLLLEKEIFPRYKPCGGAISNQALSYLGFKLPDDIIERDIFGARVHYNQRSVEVSKDDRVAVLVTRSKFDDYLLKQAESAGVDVQTGKKVLEYIEGHDEVQVVLPDRGVSAKFLIIAEGSQGNLKLRIRRQDKKSEYALCLVTEIPTSQEESENRILRPIDIYFGPIGMGYGWVFRHRGYLSVGIAGVASTMQNPRNTLNEFLKERGLGCDCAVKAHKLPAGGIGRILAGARVVLCGDSAGLVDSFYGEGVKYAIRSGQLAVDVISGALSVNPYNTIPGGTYEALCRKEFQDNLKWSFKLSRMVHGFPRIFLNLMASDRDVMIKFLDVVSSNMTYKEYRNWIIRKLPGYFIGLK
jgi:geranylgeranyl reductase family protein